MPSIARLSWKVDMKNKASMLIVGACLMLLGFIIPYQNLDREHAISEGRISDLDRQKHDFLIIMRPIVICSGLFLLIGGLYGASKIEDTSES